MTCGDSIRRAADRKPSSRLTGELAHGPCSASDGDEAARAWPEPPKRVSGPAGFGEKLALIRTANDVACVFGHLPVNGSHVLLEGIGWEYVHRIIDDCSRVAYPEIHDHEQAITVTAFTPAAGAIPGHSVPRLGLGPA